MSLEIKHTVYCQRVVRFVLLSTASATEAQPVDALTFFTELRLTLPDGGHNHVAHTFEGRVNGHPRHIRGILRHKEKLLY